MAFNVKEPKYAGLNQQLDLLEESELPYLVAVQDPGGLAITETVPEGDAGKMLVGGILAWYIRELCEREGTAAAREWLEHAFQAAASFVADSFDERVTPPNLFPMDDGRRAS